MLNLLSGAAARKAKERRKKVNLRGNEKRERLE
jgi:hypothetical protein